MARIGQVAYQLDLPDTCRIHSVVHVSQLKKNIPPQVDIEDDIAAIPDDPMMPIQPTRFVASRMIQKGGSHICQIQVQWIDCPSTLLTWEEAEDLNRCFPRSSAC